MKKTMKIVETIFCVGYLFFAFVSAIIFLMNKEKSVFLLYGIMTLLLGLGDSFHLVPRIIKNLKGESEKINWWMNLGIVITSITMTLFYILMFYLWKELNPTVRFKSIFPILIWSTAIARIIICLLPQNNWFKGGNFRLSVCRNLIFCFTGFILMLLFLIQGGNYGKRMAVCILFSFCFYMPVALFSKDNPKLGILMIPKTIMYISIIGLGLSLI